MKFKIIFILIISLLLISCTENGDESQDFILNEGSGYELSFDYSRSVPHAQNHLLRLTFSNLGTHDINNLEFNIQDNAFVNFSNNTIETDISGRSLEDPLPNTFEADINFHTTHKDDLNLRDINSRDTNTRWSVDFDYSTSDTLDVCLDDDGDVCNFVSSTSDKQGSPIQVVSTNWDIITYSDEISILYEIHLDNTEVGSPYVYMNGEKENNYVKVNSINIGNQTCDLIGSENGLVSIGSDKLIECELKRDVDSEGMLTFMNIDFEYYYQISGSIPLEIIYR